MAKFKVVMTFPNGEVVDSYEEDGDDGIFDTEQEATEYFYQWMSDYSAGGEVLHLSNPGDYPLERVKQEPDYEIVAI